MKKNKLFFFLLFLPFLVNSQSQEIRIDSFPLKPQEQKTEIDFLFHYYDQDGNNSAVTGGTGTEKLNDYDSKIQIKMALDSVSQLKINGGINYYTSASTDRIDQLLSSASKEDFQAQLFVGWEEAPENKKYRYGLNMGGATESDYLSGSLGAFIAWKSKDQSREWLLNGQVYFDRWQLFFPDELRGDPNTQVPTDRRDDYQLGLNLTQIIGPRFQASIGTDLSFQRGLLSTPFHRVYFRGEELARIERFPNSRFKIPIGIRLHYYFGDFLISRFFYRYYWDTFQLQSNTFQLGLGIKIGNAFTLTPSYRIHQQQASIYFAPFQEHEADALFYTSDFDLSSFNSQQWALNFKFTPLYGFSRWNYAKKTGLGIFKSWNWRFARYQRSDGLRAFVVSTGLSFNFLRKK